MGTISIITQPQIFNRVLTCFLPLALKLHPICTAELIEASCCLVRVHGTSNKITGIKLIVLIIYLTYTFG